MSFSVGELFSAPALNALARHTPPPHAVRTLLEGASTRLIDSGMLLQDPLLEYIAAPESRVKIPLPQFPVLNEIARIVEVIGYEGFGPYAVRFFGLLGSMMIELTGTAAQIRRVATWVDSGFTGAFCMTDRGGPLASQWRSVLPTAPPFVLNVDKVWAMNACMASFAIVVARRGNSMVLVPVVIPPEALLDSTRGSSGEPFLDGHLALGNIHFNGTFEPDWVFSQGGPISPKIFLTVARPWLIRALCAHVRWLVRHGRVRLDSAAGEGVDFLVAACRTQTSLSVFDRYSEDQAMAMKWVANEIWLELVRSGAVNNRSDQRDLLGFTKMEGSSYRCFLEIYERNKRLRRVDA